MKKLLLLDADVIFDLHTLGLFEKIVKSYDIHVTKAVLDQANYFKREEKRYKIDIRGNIKIIEDVDLENLKIVQQEAKEARLGIDPGELESIACLFSTDTMTFCSCDKAAIKLIAFMQLEGRSMSLENALRQTGQQKPLYPRHLEKSFKECIKEGKALRIQFKKLV